MNEKKLNLSSVESISKDSVLNALPKTKRGLEKYLKIQSHLENQGIEILKSREFRKLFNGFYRIRRDTEWQESFYEIFEQALIKDFSFEKILTEVQKKTNRCEPSFSSKMRASINTSAVVWDSVLLQNLNLFAPNSKDPDRLRKIVSTYELLTSKMQEVVTTNIGQFIINEFYKFHNCDKNKISNIKALDLTIWQIR